MTEEQIKEKEERRKKYEQEKPAGNQSDYKTEKEKMLKVNFDDETNWNYLFMNQDTVAISMAKKLNMEKGQLMNKYSEGSLAVKMAHAETIIVQ